MGVAMWHSPSRGRPEREHRAATSYGRPVDHGTRAFMESRFQHDFGSVRVFADDRVSEALDALGARAVTIGPSILFGRGEYAPHTPEGRRLLAHELAHVIQASRPVAGPPAPAAGHPGQTAVEADADRAAERVLSGAAARPSLLAPAAPHFKLRRNGRVPDGEYTVDMDENPGSAGLQERVRIEFMPDKSGPTTDTITFIQIAQTLTGGKALPWKDLHPDQAIVDRIRTRKESRVHETKQGDTLASVSSAHYGVPDRAASLYAANQGLGISSDPQAPLPAGQLLTVPGAVQGAFSLDIDAANTKPRQPGGPNVSGNYPHLEFRSHKTQTDIGGGLTVTSDVPGRAVGRNPKGGTPESAVMTDLPGGGPLPSTFRFETTAHAEDIGHFYGAVQWGFDYDPASAGSATPTQHITNEFARVTQHASDTVGAAIVAFNKDVGNRHVVQEGETLRAISLMYFKTSNRAYALFMLNPGVLAQLIPMRPCRPARSWSCPRRGTWPAMARAGWQAGPAERDTFWDRTRRAVPR